MANAFDSDSKDWGFESLRADHLLATKKMCCPKALIFQGFFAFIGKKSAFNFIDENGLF